MKALPRSGADPVNASGPTDASSKPPLSYRTPASHMLPLQLPKQIRQVHSYKNTSRARTPRGVSERSSDLSSPSTSRPKTPVLSEPSIFITPAIESVVKEWLSALGLQPCAPQSRLPLTQDPFRNGILACELVGLLGNQPIEGQILSPSSVGDIGRNFERALNQLRKSRPPALNPVYYGLGQRLARGNDDVLWGFYWSLYNAYPAVLPAYLGEVGKELPYDTIGIRRLEKAVLAWMQGLGVVEEYGNPDSLIDLIPPLQTGYLLSLIISSVFSLRLDHIFPHPKNPVGVINNIKKALDPLKKDPNMSQKFVWGREKDIAKGDLGVILGLLEDICRCGDGLPARKPGPGYHSDGPYCGLYGKKPVSAAVDTPEITVMGRDGVLGRTPSWKQGPNISSIEPDRHSSVMISPKNFTLGLESNVLYPGPKTDFVNDIIPSPQRKTMISFREDLPTSETAEMTDIDAELKAWLASIGINGYSDAYFGGERISDARDGVLLIEVIEILERNRIAGVNKNPRTAAGYRQNVRRALAFLRSKPAFPSELYYAEEELLSGDGKTWRKLLIEVKRMYRYAAARGRRKFDSVLTLNHS